MFTLTVLIVIWTALVAYGVSILYSLHCVGRFKDLALDMDAEKVASYPFQPSVSLAVWCNLRGEGVAGKIKRLLSLNYVRYELILVTDSSADEEGLGELVSAFGLTPRPVPEKLAALENPPRSVYTGQWNRWQAIVLVDKSRSSAEAMRDAGRTAATGEFFVWLDSIGNRLSENALIEMSLLQMRDPDRAVTRVRAGSRYGYKDKMKGNVFRMMADICSIRRQYLGGTLRNNDFGQYVVYESLGDSDRIEEPMPKPQVILSRTNHFKTYLRQLCPETRPRGVKGRFFALLELILAAAFWAVALSLAFRSDPAGHKALLLLSMGILLLVCSTFSIYIAEILLRREQKAGRVGRLILVSFPEALLFFLFKPLACLIRFFRRRGR